MVMTACVRTMAKGRAQRSPRTSMVCSRGAGDMRSPAVSRTEAPSLRLDLGAWNFPGTQQEFCQESRALDAVRKAHPSVVARGADAGPTDDPSTPHPDPDAAMVGGWSLDEGPPDSSSSH